ncbi:MULTISPECIES: LytR/AlgR family response regulator transcription factor [unclassified Aquimarina]|uniref:LytR/AlgR family response regulator transcription factor n=1 Tax=unclassified Aquimarina TaxID=2627091 RepID=UPI0018CB41B3|nr:MULTISPECIES: LytTR family DNA-binding domain-containing protein [unclassified Aquimarina]MBG6131302.1 DNA-binding LytR/AlgR family response regulator [Aquimarina sp. EL_35]MBG6151816.1 DNA-binding LytR/AlgR family response regulator [Aquimarina sp. EL_32]
MYRCLIIDDEKLARQLVENHIAKIDNFEVVFSCKSAIEAINILNSEHIDLLFLDVEMPVLLGTDFYKNLFQKPKVIFTTAYREYAVEGFELNAIDYLVKPITFGRFFKAIEKFLASQNHKIEIQTSSEKLQSKNYIFVTADRKQVKVQFDDILFVESVKNYIKIRTENKSLLVKFSISSFQEVLDARFLRVHRSFIINKDKITAYTKHDIEIGTIEIPIGEMYKNILTQIK